MSAKAGALFWKWGVALMLAVAATLATARWAEGQRPDPFAGIVTEALRNNLSLREQRYAKARAEAAEAQVRGMAMPSLGVDARYSQTSGAINIGDFINPAYAALNKVTGTSAFPTNINAQLPYTQETKLRLIQPLYQPAIGRARNLQASLVSVEEARTQATARQVAAEAQKAYLNAAKARKVVDLYVATLAVLDENLRVATKLVENGKVTADALYLARAERGDGAQKLAEAERQRDAAAEYFNLIEGRALDAALPAVDDSLLAFPLDLTLDQARSHARSSREELALADRGTQAARAQYKLAGASYMPGVSVAVDYGVQGQKYEFDRNHDASMVSVLLQWNLFNGGQDAAKREQASLEIARAETQRRDVARQIDLDVEQAYRSAVVARDAIATSGDRMEAARRGYELVSKKFREGMASQIELLDARRANTAAALNEILTRYEYATRYVELERAAALRPVAGNPGNDQ